jgi:6-phosphogluconolactonase
MKSMLSVLAQITHPLSLPSSPQDYGLALLALALALCAATLSILRAPRGFAEVTGAPTFWSASGTAAALEAEKHVRAPSVAAAPPGASLLPANRHGAVAPADAGDSWLLYVGTYTGEKSKGIYAYRMDAKTGLLTSLGLAAETVNPTFLAIHPNGRFLYAANEIDNYKDQRAGALSAYAIESKTGKLTPLNQQSSGGAGPCHLTVDHTGKYVLAANYGGGSVIALPIQEGGQLGTATAFVQHQGSSVNPRRQTGPHAHGIYLDNSNRCAFVCDLGLDKILCYRFDANRGTLTANEPPFTATQPGAGPRHFTFHPNGRFAYAINELNNTVCAYLFDDKRIELKPLQTIKTLPDDFQGNSTTAEIEVHPSGKFLYGSNRGHDSIVVYAVDNQNGTIKLVEFQSTQGKTPRGFAIDPAGRFLVAANQSTHDLRVFGIDSQTGRLKPTGQILEIGAPVCIQFLPGK